MPTISAGEVSFTNTLYPSDTTGSALLKLKYAKSTADFILSSGSTINKVGDRIFVGGAVENDGDYPNVQQDWYTQYEKLQGRDNGIIVSSQMAVLTNDYFGATVGLTVAAQTKNFITGVGGAVALEAHVINNNTTTSHDAWGIYSEATRDSENVGHIITAELDARNKGNYHPITPYAQHPKMSVVLQLASGAALPGAGVSDISAFINLRQNPTMAGAGIVFGASSIRGTDGVNGVGNAIMAALGHQFVWTNSAGLTTGVIWGAATNTANKTGLVFHDSGLLVLGPTNQTIAVFRPVTNATNYLDFQANTAGSAPVIRASGSDANIDLQIEPTGGGLLRFGNGTSFAANGTKAVSLGATGPSAASAGPVKWLKVKDNTGAVVHIPCF